MRAEVAPMPGRSSYLAPASCIAKQPGQPAPARAAPCGPARTTITAISVGSEGLCMPEREAVPATTRGSRCIAGAHPPALTISLKHHDGLSDRSPSGRHWCRQPAPRMAGKTVGRSRPCTSHSARPQPCRAGTPTQRSSCAGSTRWGRSTPRNSRTAR